jgi:hypothetical protein
MTLLKRDIKSLYNNMSITKHKLRFLGKIAFIQDSMYFIIFISILYFFYTLGDIGYSMENKLSYTVVFDESLNFNNILLNLSLPASE